MALPTTTRNLRRWAAEGLNGPLPAAAMVLFLMGCGDAEAPAARLDVPAPARTVAARAHPPAASAADTRAPALQGQARPQVVPDRPVTKPFAGSPAVEREDIADLQSRALSLPVEGLKATALQDTFGDGRSQGAHEALDIAAPRRTPVRAVEDGVVTKLFTSVRGGLTIYQFDPGSRYAYYYAHLDAYAAGLQEGQRVKRCDLLGYVGVTGNAPVDAPHLHFAIFKLEPARQWWRGTPVNPYTVMRQGAAVSQACPPLG